MKTMSTIILGAWLAGVSVVGAEEPGVVRAGVLAGISTDALVTTLNQEDGLEAFVIPRPNPRMFADLDVLVVTQQRIPALLTRQIPAIVDWVNQGGGVLMLHDAVGYRQHIPMFPRVGSGTTHTMLNQARIAKEHPVTQGLEKGHVFTHGFQHDHISLEPGPDGIAVVDNENDEAVVVVGESEEGRVVLNGMLTGGWGTPDMDWGEEREGYPKGAERTVLIQSVRWLSGEQSE